MLRRIKEIIKKFLPYKWLLGYHWCLAQIAARIYNYPSRQLIVVGVTGTAGKSTTVNLIAKVLEAEGDKVGLASTMNFQIGDKSWTNTTKMTMLGPLKLQRFLREMLNVGCKYAVIETSSEGIRNFRHLGIEYDAAVLTNLTPEHIESHGSFEQYRAEKEKLFAGLVGKRSKILNKKVFPKISIINLDDPQCGSFWSYPVKKRLGFSLKPETVPAQMPFVAPDHLVLTPFRATFEVRGVPFKLNLPGIFNVYNALAAVSLAVGWELDLTKVSAKLAEIQSLDGRMEQVDCGQNFKIYVDYAHTPESLEQVYQTLQNQLKTQAGGRLIAILGSCGGGRDRAKRAPLGRLAGQYADVVIVTNEDPYDEPPQEIIDQVASGVAQTAFKGPLFKILDRKEAIAKACQLAVKNDIIILTGKGNEQWLMGPRGSRVSWDERKVIREILGC